MTFTLYSEVVGSITWRIRPFFASGVCSDANVHISSYICTVLYQFINLLPVLNHAMVIHT